MILETIISSIDKDGKVNFAPIGVRLQDDFAKYSEVKEFDLILYSGSQTFANLKNTLEGVINFTDDIMAFVETSLFSKALPTIPSCLVRPPRMAEAKEFWEFSVDFFDDDQEPARVQGKVLFNKELGCFRGFCRAHGVILEATIAATRLSWISPREIINAWPFWQEVVQKTGGRKELEAFSKVSSYLLQRGIPIQPQAKVEVTEHKVFSTGT